MISFGLLRVLMPLVLCDAGGFGLRVRVTVCFVGFGSSGLVLLVSG